MKIAILLGVFLFCSGLNFGQAGIDQEPAEKSDTVKIKLRKAGVVKVETDVSANFYLADPSMPIAVPPKNLSPGFPVKKLPKDFPSDLPVYGPNKKYRCLGIVEY